MLGLALAGLAGPAAQRIGDAVLGIVGEVRGVRVVHGDDVGLAAEAVDAVVVGDRPHALRRVDLVAGVAEEGDEGAARRIACRQRQAVERGHLHARHPGHVLRAARQHRPRQQRKAAASRAAKGSRKIIRASTRHDAFGLRCFASIMPEVKVRECRRSQFRPPLLTLWPGCESGEPARWRSWNRFPICSRANFEIAFSSALPDPSSWT